MMMPSNVIGGGLKDIKHPTLIWSLLSGVINLSLIDHRKGEHHLPPAVLGPHVGCEK